MRLLFDSHVFLWAAQGEESLSPAAKKALAQADAEKFLSVASIWELAIKTRLGRLELGAPLAEIIEIQRRINGIAILPVLETHALRVQELELFHKDPFDRLLVGQCLVEDLTLVSADALLDAYGIRRLW